MPYRPANDSTINYIGVALVGPPGAGKTMLAGTPANCFILDVDNGASGARRPRWEFPYSPAGYREFRGQLQLISTLVPNKEGMLEHPEGFQFDVLVIDTLNTAQELLALDIPPEKNKLRWYGKLLDRFRAEVLSPILQSNVNWTAVFHTKVDDVDRNRFGDPIEKEVSGQDTAPSVVPAIDGSMSERLPRWFDVIYYVVQDQSGTRWLLTQPKLVGARYYEAKDRYYLADGQNITFAITDKGAETDIMARVFSKTTGGIRQAFRDRAVEETRQKVIDKAKECGLFKNGQVHGNRLLGEIAGGRQITWENHEVMAAELIADIENYIPHDVAQKRISAVKAAWLQAAHEAGIIEDLSEPQRGEIEIAKEVLGNLYTNIDPRRWEEQIASGKELLASWDPDAITEKAVGLEESAHGKEKGQ